MAQVQKNKQTTKTAVEEAEVEPKDLKNPQLDADLEDIMDAIDECIGELGEEFALTFVQQGGQ
jgi:ubiquitin-like protein Pup